MAKNGPKGGGRHGAVRGRSQFRNSATGSYTKPDTKTGRFMDSKADSKRVKGVRREK